MRYLFDKKNADALLGILQNDDIVEIHGKDLKELLHAGNAGSRGRRPIQVDMSLFNEIVGRWKNGEITARQAMRELHLKPNTFYRRIRLLEERSAAEMASLREEIGELKALVRVDAAELISRKCISGITAGEKME